MNIKLQPAALSDALPILSHDRHIARGELERSIGAGRVIVALSGKELCAFLRYGLFWDNTPFCNMLFVLAEYRGRGIGRKMILFWEEDMRQKGYPTVMTSTASDESAQHFYRKLGYVDTGCLLQDGSALEIFLTHTL